MSPYNNNSSTPAPSRASKSEATRGTTTGIGRVGERAWRPQSPSAKAVQEGSSRVSFVKGTEVERKITAGDEGDTGFPETAQVGGKTSNCQRDLVE
ncbi:hypothetical protein FOPE_01917 [Fonsecaea pedrosoi]|nr:hypothetical protein FOPE_01917 [Fonsecaea pedrosoi]